MPDYNELDYCDLDPTKLCDNCCRCIDTGNDYEEFDIELTHQIEELEDLMREEDEMVLELMSDEGFWEEEPGDIGQSGLVGPIKIDPKLVAEWEKRLRES